MEFILILKKLEDDLTTEEEVVFNHWYEESPEHVAYFEKIKGYYLRMNDFPLN